MEHKSKPQSGEHQRPSETPPSRQPQKQANPDQPDDEEVEFEIRPVSEEEFVDKVNEEEEDLGEDIEEEDDEDDEDD